MFIKKPKEKIVIDEVICDVCNKTCKGTHGNEFATLEAYWGYTSNKDCTHSQCHLCETCFDKVSVFVKSLGGIIREEEYNPFLGYGQKKEEW